MLKRDPDFISKQIYLKGESYHSKEKTIIEFPAWYGEKGFYEAQELTTLYGVFAIIIGDKYSVSRIPTFIKTAPIAVSEIDRNGETYIQLLYGKDDPIIHSVKAIKHSISSYTYFETNFMKTREPWFIEPDDVVLTMDNMPKYAGSNIGANFIANEFIVSFITRSSKDKTKYYRQTDGKGPYEYVDLMNVFYSTVGLANKLSGNYLKSSIVSAIVQKNTGETKLERHLRT